MNALVLCCVAGSACVTTTITTDASVLRVLAKNNPAQSGRSIRVSAPITGTTTGTELRGDQTVQIVDRQGVSHDIMVSTLYEACKHDPKLCDQQIIVGHERKLSGGAETALDTAFLLAALAPIGYCADACGEPEKVNAGVSLAAIGIVVGGALLAAVAAGGH